VRALASAGHPAGIVVRGAPVADDVILVLGGELRLNGYKFVLTSVRLMHMLHSFIVVLISS